jgi:hypothetical protein
MSGWLNEILTFVKDHWPDAKDFLELLIAIVGSFAGALGAQRMADKTRSRDELLKEIRATNVAAMVAFSICNTLLSAKKMHIKALKETFEAQRISAIDALKKQQAGTGGVVAYLGNFNTLPVLDLPVSILQTQIFEKLSLQGRPIYWRRRSHRRSAR